MRRPVVLLEAAVVVGHAEAVVQVPLGFGEVLKDVGEVAGLPGGARGAGNAHPREGGTCPQGSGTAGSSLDQSSTVPQAPRPATCSVLSPNCHRRRRRRLQIPEGTATAAWAQWLLHHLHPSILSCLCRAVNFPNNESEGYYNDRDVKVMLQVVIIFNLNH